MMQAQIFAGTLNMERDDWLARRREGIGGSDAAAILGMSPWKSAYAVYMDKRGLLPEKEPTEALWWGTQQEELVAKRFTELTGKGVRRLNAILQHPQYPFMLANIDRRITGERAGLECKTTEIYNPTDFKAGEVPPTYYWQCIHYLAVTGWDRWYLAVKVGNGNAFHTYEIERNAEHIELLKEAEREFWEEHVEKEVPPLPSGLDCDSEIIAASAQGEDGGCADLSGVSDTLTLLALLKADGKALDKRIKQAEQMVQLALDGAEKGVCDGWEVTWKPQVRTTIDTKKLKGELPEVFEQYKRQSESRVFKIKRGKEDAE